MAFALVAVVGGSPPKALGVLVGIVVIGAGIALIVAAERLTRAFNAMYRELPGRIVYPSWFIPAIGWFAVVFGAVAAMGTLVFAR